MESVSILDPCCGSRMFWFDKEHKNTIYCDIRREQYELCDGRILSIDPDCVMDFRDLNFDDEIFSLVVFDPPHLVNLGSNSRMAKKYGKLSKNWKEDIKKGFDECWRVLKKGGTLIFKWSERDITNGQIIKIIKKTPLFGNKIGKTAVWLVFQK